MIEPVALEDFFITFFSSALVIVFGALYALLFAWSRVKQIKPLMPWAYAAYGLLVASVLVLASATHLNGYWQTLVALMLFGYLLAPHGIWHLCVGTHDSTDSTSTHHHTKGEES